CGSSHTSCAAKRTIPTRGRYHASRMKRVSRRKILVAGGLLALGGVVALVRTSGYVVPDGTKLTSLEPWQWLLVRDLARRVCAPDAPGVVTPDATDVAGFVDAYAEKMPPKQRRDLFRFLRFVEQLAPAAKGYASRFTRLASEDQDRVLESLEANSN